MVALAEDPQEGWRRMAPFFLHETNAYGVWQAQEQVAFSVLGGEDEAALWCTGQYAVLTPEESLLGVEGRPVPVHPPPPALRLILSFSAWSSLRVVEAEVVPAFA